ncbi:MAG: hypothetical protein ACD_70C00209G0003, partial [uncultured bacterium]
MGCMPKQYKKKDPHRKREAKRYEHPVPSREFILQYLHDMKAPVRFEELLDAFSLRTEAEKEGLTHRLKAMLRDGQLMLNRRMQYGV